MRVKGWDELKIGVSKGDYGLCIKGMYGEDYDRLKEGCKWVKGVSIWEFRSGYRFSKAKGSCG